MRQARYSARTRAETRRVRRGAARFAAAGRAAAGLRTLVRVFKDRVSFFGSGMFLIVLMLEPRKVTAQYGGVAGPV